MTTNKMKKILAEKFDDEWCSFKYKDISIKKAKRKVWLYDTSDEPVFEAVEGYEIVIKEYEHIHFFIHTEEDEYFGNIVYTTRVDYDRNGKEIEAEVIDMNDSKFVAFDVLMVSTLVHLGYYIASRF